MLAESVGIMTSSIVSTLVGFGIESTNQHNRRKHDVNKIKTGQVDLSKIENTN